MTYTIEPMDQNYHRLVKRDPFGHVLYRSKPLRSNELLDLEDALRVHRLGMVRYDPMSVVARDVPGWRLYPNQWDRLWYSRGAHEVPPLPHALCVSVELEWHARTECVDDTDEWADGTYKDAYSSVNDWCARGAEDVAALAYEILVRCVDTTSPRCSPSRAIPADLTCAA